MENRTIMPRPVPDMTNPQFDTDTDIDSHSDWGTASVSSDACVANPAEASDENSEEHLVPNADENSPEQPIEGEWDAVSDTSEEWAVTLSAQETEQTRAYIKMIQDHVDDLEAQIYILEDQISTLKSQYEELESDHNYTTMEMKCYKFKFNEQAEKVEKLEGEMKVAIFELEKKYLGILEAKNQEMQSKMRLLVAEKQELQTSLKCKIEGLMVEKGVLQTRLQQQIDALVADKKGLETKLKREEECNRKMESTIRNVFEDHVKALTAVEDLKHERDQFKAALASREAAMKSMDSRINQLVEAHQKASTAVDSLTAERDRLKQETAASLSQQTQMIRTLEVTYEDKLKAEVMGKEALWVKLSETENTLDMVRRRLLCKIDQADDKLVKSSSRLREQEAAYKEKLEAAVKEKGMLQFKLAMEAVRKENLQKNLKAEVEKKEELQTKLKNEEEKAKVLEVYHEKEVKDLRAEGVDLNSKLEDESCKLQKEKLKVATLKNEVHGVEGGMMTAVIVNEMLQAKLIAEEENVMRLEREYLHMHDYQMELQSHLAAQGELKLHLEEKEKEVTELQAHLAEKTNKVTELEARMKEVEEKYHKCLEHASEEREMAQMHTRESRKRFEAQSQAQSTKISEMEQESKRLNSAMDRLTKALKDTAKCLNVRVRSLPPAGNWVDGKVSITIHGKYFIFSGPKSLVMYLPGRHKPHIPDGRPLVASVGRLTDEAALRQWTPVCDMGPYLQALVGMENGNFRMLVDHDYAQWYPAFETRINGLISAGFEITHVSLGTHGAWSLGWMEDGQPQHTYRRGNWSDGVSGEEVIRGGVSRLWWGFKGTQVIEFQDGRKPEVWFPSHFYPGLEYYLANGIKGCKTIKALSLDRAGSTAWVLVMTNGAVAYSRGDHSLGQTFDDFQFEEFATKNFGCDFGFMEETKKDFLPTSCEPFSKDL